MVQRRRTPRQCACTLPSRVCNGIIEVRLGMEEVVGMSRQTTGIIALVLGVLVLIWPSWLYVVFGVLLILIGVMLLMGKMKSPF